MNDIRDKLENLSENKLIDVVKNYRQYGYTEEYRNLALNILSERGIDEMTLKLRGQFENTLYNDAQIHFKKFLHNSNLAFSLYLLSILLFFILPLFLSIELSSILILICSFAYLLFFVLSFINQANFYSAIGKSYMAENPIIFLLLSVPIYFIVFFYFKKKMKNQLSEIY